MIIIGVFLDTGFFVGICHKKDKNYEKSKKILNKLTKGELGLLYTSSFIISEATTLTAIRSRNNIKILNHLGTLIWGKEKLATILIFDSELERQTWDLFKKVNTIDLKDKRTMSFVDISSVILSRHHQIDKIVSFDPHFDRFLQRIYK